MSWIDAVNRFWFEELSIEDCFSARPEVDAAIHARFGDLRAHLKQHPPLAGDLDPAGHLAAVVVFDQFSRNLFRRSPEAYATDPLALALADDAVGQGMDGAMSVRQRQFLYMPFMHSEDRAIQSRSVALFAALRDADLLGFAQHHHDVIQRFARFPHRNEILGRPSTAEEQAFLLNERPHP